MSHVKDNLAAFLAGEMAPAEAAALQEHLQGCRSCRAELEAMRGVWAALAVAAPAAGTHPTQWPAIRRRTFGEAAGKNQWFFGRGGLTRAGLATAAVAIGLALGIWVPGRGSGDKAGPVAAVALETADAWLESTWLDTTQDSGLSEMWLSAGQTDEGSGS